MSIFADTNKYNVTRFFKDSYKRRTIRQGLTLDEAQAHCRDDESSSSTCTNALGKARTSRLGQWFDGYEKE